MIDWDSPHGVEADETPPRPVRVLFDKNNTPCGFLLDGRFYGIYGTPEGHGLRNVAPKPVRHEAWVNLYASGVSGSHSTRKASDELSSKGWHPFVECRHIVWNSDGSPVSGADAGPEYWMNRFTEMTADRDAWERQCQEWAATATKQVEEIDRLKAELAQEKRNVLTLVKTVARQEEAARSHNQWLDRTRPVVEAAVVEDDADGCNRDTACDTVKLCSTCRWDGGNFCKRSRKSECGPYDFKLWEPKPIYNAEKFPAEKEE